MNNFDAGRNKWKNTSAKRDPGFGSRAKHYTKPGTKPDSSAKKPNESTSWGGVASWYDGLLEGQDKGNTYQTTLILPNLKRLVDPKPGLKILDLACGQGFFARAWSVNGAEVTASDVAPELIKIAKAIDGTAGNVKYFTKPSTDLTFAQNDSIDVVTCVLAVQNIEHLAETFKECARVLKPQTGRMYLVLNHPTFRIPKRSGWAFDEKGDAQFRRIDAYMSDARLSIDMTPGIMDKTAKQYTVSFHRPLQTYFKALSKAGLAVTKLEEWISNKESLPGKRSNAENTARKEIPLFMCLEIVKI